MSMRIAAQPLLGWGVPVVVAMGLGLAAGFDRGWPLVLASLGAWLTVCAANLGMLLPFIGLPLFLTRGAGWRWLVVFALVFVLDQWFLLCPSLSVWAGLRWNWQGKVLATLSVLWIVVMGAKVSLSEAGIVSSWQKGWWIPIVVSLTLLALIHWLKGNQAFSYPPETFWFQATMPGIHEEMAMRGLMLALLVRAFDKPGLSPRGAWIWAGVLITLSFGFLHVFQSKSLGQLTATWGRMDTAVIGVFFLWARIHSGSIWPAVLIHNLCNLEAMNQG